MGRGPRLMKVFLRMHHSSSSLLDLPAARHHGKNLFGIQWVPSQRDILATPPGRAPLTMHSHTCLREDGGWRDLWRAKSNCLAADEKTEA